jgi:hypothetical protein
MGTISLKEYLKNLTAKSNLDGNDILPVVDVSTDSLKSTKSSGVGHGIANTSNDSVLLTIGSPNGYGNVLIGSQSFSSANALYTSVGIGRGALANASTIRSVFIGYNAGSNVGGMSSNNIGIGFHSLQTATTGVYNVGIGTYAQTNVSTGSSNIGIGFTTQTNLTTGVGNITMGTASLANATVGSHNIALGTSSLFCTTSGSYNIATGREALFSNTTGCNNIATGYSALFSNTTGRYNIATGQNALCRNTTGEYNIAIGRDALRCNTTGSYNIAIGASVLHCNTTGFQNIATGREALFSNTTGSYNIATGREALFSNTTGSNNIATGYSALTVNTTGSNNIATGLYALGSNTTGSNNTAIGACAQSATGFTASCTIAVGFNACTSNTDCHTRWGNANHTVLNCIAAAWTVCSDCRDKSNIEPLPTQLGLDFITRLNPVQFNWDARELYVSKCGYEYGEKDGTLASPHRSYGLVAQELKAVLDDLGVEFDALKYTEEHDAYHVTYEELIPVLIRAVQELNTRLVDVETKVNA